MSQQRERLARITHAAQTDAEREETAHKREADGPHIAAFVGNAPMAGAQRRAAVQSLGQQQGNRAVQRTLGTAQRSAAAGHDGGPLEETVVRQIQNERSNGQPLDAGLRREAEGVVGADLSAVRVHTGSTAAALNREVGARAFTTGRDIFFGANTGPTDRAVLLHEVTHTVQQGMGEEPPSMVGAADTAHEQAAESTASAGVERCCGDDEAQRMIARTLLQRDDDDSGGGDDDSGGATQDDAAADTEAAPLESALPPTPAQQYTAAELTALDPSYAPDYGPGDYPAPADDGTAMALRLADDAAVQRDDEKGPGVEPEIKKFDPLTLDITGAYKGVHLFELPPFLGGLQMFTDPQLQVEMTQGAAGVTPQLGLGLFQRHFSLLGESWSATLRAQAETQILPLLKQRYGGAINLEGHIFPSVSVEAEAGLMWQPGKVDTPAETREFEGTLKLKVEF